MAVRQVSAETAVAPNLVPMVDIMFLLLLFLMIGADMGDRELEEVHLPLAQSAKEEKKDGPDEKLTLNVYHAKEGCSAYDATKLCGTRDHWAIGVRGTDYRDEDKLAAHLKALAKEDCEKRSAELPDIRVQIRADQAAMFEQVQIAMGCCAAARIYKVEIGAATMAASEAE
ncbi:MAG: biopolymer transporter ExbD [Planctomycetota bacterium]